MAWGQGNKQPEPDADAAGRSRFAAPPTCPRCELTKSQVSSGCVAAVAAAANSSSILQALLQAIKRYMYCHSSVAMSLHPSACHALQNLGGNSSA
jgi:hypothetical protein